MSFLNRFNFIHRCKKYSLSLWQYPPFVFVFFGIFIICAILLTYFIGARYLEPEPLICLLVSVTIILFILNYIIVNSFENLAEANLMRAEFISIISHQMRGPLSNIKWVLEILSTVGMTEKEKEEYLKNIQDKNEYMIKLIDDIVFASKIGQKKWVFKKEETDFKSVINKIVDNVRLSNESKDVKIEINIDDFSTISIDRRNFTKALSNLLDNAIRYTEKGGAVKIMVRKKAEKIIFKIKDNGVGIPEREKKYIFQEFFRSKNVLKYRTDGTGLGLFVAKNIIDAMGGKIEFKSKEGKGSIFWFELPI